VGTVLGDLLPLALGVAISPVPIIAVILMLFAPKAGGASFGFLAGWVIGIALAVTAFALIAGTAGMGTGTQPSTLASWLKLLLGLLLIYLAYKNWRERGAAVLPKWMSAIDSMTAGKATGLGFLLSAVNPKNLALCAAAGTVIGGGGLSGADNVLTVVIFTILAALTVAVPVIGYAVAKDRMRGPLDRLKSWLETNNAIVMAVLLLVLGVVLLGKGIGGLS
jgi:threonine/homoserine/homoserine lactone efflux protein